jgi:NAD+ kinase
MARKRKGKKNKLSIMIVAKQNKSGIAHAKKLEKMLKRRTKNVHIDRSTAFRLRRPGTSVKKFKGDLIITVGGDGTFLLTAHMANVPILPVKIEGKGFLCTTNFKELEKNIKRIFRKDYTITERARLKCIKLRSGKLEKYIGKIHSKEYPFSVNEVVFARKRPSKLLNIKVKIDDTVFDMAGDGVMFSTPSGSTAYNASAGGPIIDPKLNVMNIVPLYPFYSKVKPIVVPMDKKIEITVHGGDCALIIDGHEGDYFQANSRFVIEKAKPVKVVAFREQNFYENVRKHLFE